MAQKQVRFVNFKERRSYENTRPVALHYYGRFELYDWQELYYAAMKCLYLEFPDIISGFCGTDSKRSLFLRTTTLDMKKPRVLGEALYLEADRSPTRIVYALQTILEQIGMEDGLMRIEYERMDAPLPDAPPRPPSFRREAFTRPAPDIERNGNQFPQAISTEEVSIEPILIVKQKGKELYFIICGRMQGPFPTECARYIGLMTFLAEAFPDCLHQQAGRHINSLHRLTLVKGMEYRYFKEPVELPNGLYMDCDFPEDVLRENERYYIEACSLVYEDVIL